MDHSYRAAMAAATTMGTSGGRQRPGFADAVSAARARAVAGANEDANSRIFAFVDDLVFHGEDSGDGAQAQCEGRIREDRKDLMDQM